MHGISDSKDIPLQSDSMKIAIYDIEHFETTYTLVRLLQPENNSITVFTTASMYPVLKDMLGSEFGQCKWVVKEDGHFSFVKMMRSYCKENGVVYIFLNTVAYHHLYFAWLCYSLPHTKSVVTVHAANSFFRPGLRLGLRNFARYVGQKLLATTATSYAVLLQSTKKYVLKKFNVCKPVYVLPGSLFEHHKNPAGNNSNVIRLVVCGSIDQYRRNYEDVFTLAYKLEGQRAMCEIVLLGAPVGTYGKNILQKCKEAKSEFVRFIYFEKKFIENDEYAAQINRSDFIFLPLEKDRKKPDERSEEYGLTVCSGTFFDAVKFGKPILIHESIYLSEEIKEQCIQYSSIFNLSELIANLSKNDLDNYKAKALLNASHFTIEKIRGQLPAELFEN